MAKPGIDTSIMSYASMISHGQSKND